MKFGDFKITKPSTLTALIKGDIHNAIISETTGGIEAQEAAGQRSFVANETLPIQCPRAELEQIGFVFGKPVDDLFVSVQFPAGWRKQATDHSMWSDLLDEKGRKRGSIFYKAAFYDRDAFMRINRRYSTVCTYDNPRVAQIKDGDTIIWQSQPYAGEKTLSFEISEELGGIAETMLTEMFPDWKNPLAYWD